MRSTFEQDIEAGRGAIDTEQYGRPQYADEENESAGLNMAARTPSPPISGSNYEEGAIPVDESAALNTAARPQPGDNSGAAPVMPPAAQQGDNSGAAPVTPGQPQQPAQQGSRSGVDFNAAHVPGNMKRIVSYLMGADA